MKPLTLPLRKPNMFRNFSLSAVILSAAAVFAAIQSVPAQQTQLSLADLLTGLRSRKVTLPERNKLLVGAVKSRGVTFSVTPEIEKELESTGADQELMSIIKEKAVPAPEEPTVKPAPPAAPVITEAVMYKTLANEHFAKGDFDLALAAYGKVIELNAADADVYFNRGTAYFGKRTYDKAIADFDKAIEMDPKRPRVYSMRGSTYEKVGNVDKAVADYKKALELDPNADIAKASLKKIEDEKAQAAAAAAEKERQAAAEAAAKAAQPAGPIDVGSLNNLAIKLAVPVYPAIERQMNRQGLVVVRVTLDEEGKVLEAQASSGPKSLQEYAEDAARKSKFNPATANGKPVKATGYITYNFVAGRE